MKVLISGANGFLGRRVVRAFVEQGVDVRAMARPGQSLAHLGWPPGVEPFHADLLTSDDLVDAFEGVDALVHLAGGAPRQSDRVFDVNVTATRRLLSAMAGSGTRKLVHCSSMSVYDFRAARDVLNEDTPLEQAIEQRDAYAIAKFRQERLVRESSSANSWDLCVLRPGFVWGEGSVDVAGIGRRVGPCLVVIGSRSRCMPLTHVDNCADCFVRAATDGRAVGQTFNVVDDESITAWDYSGEYLRGTGSASVRLSMPYGLAHALVRGIDGLNAILGQPFRLPSLLVERRFEARFKPLRFSNEKLLRQLDWKPPLDYATCLARAFPPA